MKKVIACTQIVFLGLALSVTATTYAGTNSIQQAVHRSSRKSYLKHQKKAAKKTQKSQKKAMNRLKKQHRIGH